MPSLIRRHPVPALAFAALAALAAALAASCDNTSPVEPACTYAVTPGSVSVGAQGGSQSAAVSTTSGCACTAQANAGWLTITSGASGTGPGTVAFTVGTNTVAAVRTGTVSVADQTVTVTQAAAASPSCTYAVTPASAAFTKDGGTGSVSVAAPPGCLWTAASGAAWLTITAGAQGSGDGSVSYTVARHEDPAGRETTMEVAGQSVQVSQSGDVGACQYSVSPVSFSPCLIAPEMTVVVTTSAACPWTAAPDESWISLTHGASGMGSGEIGFRVSDNYDAPRLGVVMVRWPTPTAGQNVQVAQAGCHYAAVPAAIAIAKAGGTGSVDVYQVSDPIECGGGFQDRCVWSTVSNVPWITITSHVPTRGDGPVRFTVAPNPDSTPRTGTITVRDQTVTITQSGT